MGILITTDLEMHIHDVLAEGPTDSTELVTAIVDSLADADYIRDDVDVSEYPLMMDLINSVVATPCHPKNTPKQDLWRKARGISLKLINEKYRENGYLKGFGRIHTTRNPIVDALAPDPGTLLH